jgi:glycosyltransferase involved in cell wall biosynthesis
LVKINILLIGSLPPPVGGTAISLLYLIKELNRNSDINISVLNTTEYKHRSKYIKLIISILRGVHNVDVVSLHVSSSSLPFIGTLVLIMCRIYNKPFIVRKFGGTNIHAMPLLKRLLGVTVLNNCDMYLAQTKELVRIAENNGITHVHWYPTSRPFNPQTREVHHNKNNGFKRFVFIGHIRSDKGIHEIIEAAKNIINEKALIDLYGETNFDINPVEMNNIKNIRYMGKYDPTEVYEILKNYDVLLLPSYHSGEGYPGAIIEAFQTGIPVICTNWKALPELVDETCGILIPPKNPESLINSMRKLLSNNEYLALLKRGALNRGKQFSSDEWASKFVDYCKTLIENKN